MCRSASAEALASMRHKLVCSFRPGPTRRSPYLVTARKYPRASTIPNVARNRHHHTTCAVALSRPFTVPPVRIAAHQTLRWSPRVEQNLPSPGRAHVRQSRAATGADTLERGEALWFCYLNPDAELSAWFIQLLWSLLMYVLSGEVFQQLGWELRRPDVFRIPFFRSYDRLSRRAVHDLDVLV